MLLSQGTHYPENTQMSAGFTDTLLNQDAFCWQESIDTIRKNGKLLSDDENTVKYVLATDDGELCAVFFRGIPEQIYSRIVSNGITTITKALFPTRFENNESGNSPVPAQIQRKLEVHGTGHWITGIQEFDVTGNLKPLTHAQKQKIIGEFYIQSENIAGDDISGSFRSFVQLGSIGPTGAPQIVANDLQISSSHSILLQKSPLKQTEKQSSLVLEVGINGRANYRFQLPQYIDFTETFKGTSKRNGRYESPEQQDITKKRLEKALAN